LALNRALSFRVYNFLSSNGPASLRKVADGVDEKSDLVGHCLRRLWKKELILRTREPVFRFENCHNGRAGLVGHTRAVNRYVLNDGEAGAIYVKYNERMKDGRSKGIVSKSQLVLDFLRKNKDRAFYSVDIVKELKINTSDVMANVRRHEKKGLVFVRGYQSHDQRSPFKKGFILTWIDQDLPRDKAIKEAFERTNKVILENPTSNTIHERIRLIKDQLLTSNELLSMAYLRNILHCDIDSAKRALKRARQLYPDIKQVKIFDKFAYYHLDSVKPEDLNANIEMKKNYIRIRFGRDNRIGHNWEAVVEWFIDKFTEGAEFQRQNHRRNIDTRRITLHLLKPVGSRKQSAEVDRVWKVTPGLFSPTVTYVLECKYSVVTRRTLDDFIEVLKWSTDFGVDTENGREVKKGVIPVFGAGAYNPKEKVVVNGQKITLAQYASRMNIRLLRPADFNSKLRERGVGKKVTVQKICRVCKDEKDVRVNLDEIWQKPLKAQKALDEALNRNQQVFEFERVLVS
jgi:DNA-binding MarR family transcriptional regulator